MYSTLRISVSRTWRLSYPVLRRHAQFSSLWRCLLVPSSQLKLPLGYFYAEKTVKTLLVAESGRWTLRSTERSVCVIQRCNNTFGDRSFAVAGARAWNNLPVTLRNTDLTMDTFCKHLKTVLFTDSWGRGAFVTLWYYCAVYKCPY